MNTTVIIASVIIFLAVVLILVSVLLYAKSKLSPSGSIKLTINGDQEFEVEAGSTLLSTLGNQKIF